MPELVLLLQCRQDDADILHYRPGFGYFFYRPALVFILHYRPALVFILYYRTALIFQVVLPSGGGTASSESLQIKPYNLFTLAPEKLPDTGLKRLERDRDE